MPAHTLVVYGASDRSDTTLGRLARAAAERGDRVTVVALTAQEPVARQCCDTRSVLWNEICTDLARADLERASRAAGAPVDCDVLYFPGRRAADAVAGEALARSADAIVLAGGLGRLARRRLRRLSAVPVRD